VLQPQVINLNSVVEEMGKLLPRLIGEDIELVIRGSEDLGANTSGCQPNGTSKS